MFGLFDQSASSPEKEAAPSDGRLTSLWAEGERLLQQTAGDLTALGTLIASVPGALKDAVLEASHRLLGSQATAEAVERSSPSARTDEHADQAPAPDALHQVMQHAGERVADDGGFEYEVGVDGSFEIVVAPPTAQGAMHRKLQATGKFAKPWQTLAGKLGVTVTATAAPATPAFKAAPVSNNNVAAEPSAMGADAATGVDAIKTNAPTLEGDTLAIAKTRADMGVANTQYLRTFDKTAEGKAAEKQFATDLASGATTQDTFYCSGLSIWTLAAAGYEMSTRMKGDDGVDLYGETHTEVGYDAKGKKTKDPALVASSKTVVNKHYVTFKDLIDGSPQAVEIMTLAKKLGGKGGSVGLITGAGYAVEHDGDGLPVAARGAAGAFEAAHVGAEVAETAQKPGDFAQSRRTTVAEGETEAAHHGAGHAWQVYSTHVRGAALFGQPGSPQAKSGALSGWHDGVEFDITADTDPATVGEHTVLSAQRIEANIGGAMEDKKSDGGGAQDKKGRYLGGDGGVQITGEKAVPDAGLSSYSGYVVFYGRLSSSRWAAWTPAKPPA